MENKKSYGSLSLLNNFKLFLLIMIGILEVALVMVVVDSVANIAPPDKPIIITNIIAVILVVDYWRLLSIMESVKLYGLSKLLFLTHCTKREFVL